MNSGIELEKHVQQVYSFLLNMKDEGIVVGQDVQIVDKFGRSHQVDVIISLKKPVFFKVVGTYFTLSMPQHSR